MNYTLFSSPSEERPKEDIDGRLNRIYLYYYHGGLTPMLVSEISRLIIYAFVVVFSIFLTSFIKYGCVLNNNSETSLSSCLEFSVGRIPVIIWILISFMSIFWLLNLLQLIIDIPELFKIRKYYREVLQIRDIIGTDWNEIADKIRTHMENDLDNLSIASRIMRKDNYTIAMFNRDLFGLKSNIYYTKVVEWALTFSVYNYIFDGEKLNPDVLKNDVSMEKRLAWRIRFCGLVFFILSPLIFVFLLTYYACSYFEQIKNTPSILGGRMWSRYAYWKFRNYNELPHYFNHRYENSRFSVEKYINSFPSPIVQTICYLISFITASLLMVIGILSIINSDILTLVTVFDHPILYYAGILSIVLATLSTNGAPAKNPFDTSKYLKDIIKDTQYTPEGCEKPASKKTYQEITSLYQYRIVIFLISVMGLFVGPLWLTFILPQRAGVILEFLRDNTLQHPTLGYVCAFSNFENIDRMNSSTEVDKDKMTKSLWTYKENNARRELDV